MPRRTRPSIKTLGLSPILKSYLTAGHSRRLTSGGTAVAAILLKLNQYPDILSVGQSPRHRVLFG